jgi:hypothetical protein
MRPEVFEFADPFMHVFQLLAFECVEPMLTLPFHGHNANIAKHGEMLGHGRLRQAQREHHRPHRQRAALREQFDDLTPPRLGDGAEDICG